MNKIYKVVWSKVKHCYVVVSEVAKANGKSGVKAIAAAAAVAVMMSGGTALAADHTIGGEYDSIAEFKAETGFNALTDNTYYCNYYPENDKEGTSNHVVTDSAVTYTTTEANGNVGILAAYSGKRNGGNNITENPNNNTLEIKHDVTINTNGYAYLYGSCIDGGADASYNAVATGNSVSLEGVTLTRGGHTFIAGALSNDGSNADVDSNKTILKDVEVKLADGSVLCVYGGEARGGSATNNEAVVEKVSVKNAEMYGGFVFSKGGDASGNTISLTDVTLGEGSTVAGGHVYNAAGNADDNTVNIEGDSKISGGVYAGIATNGTASDNVINISGNADISNASLYGDDGGEGLGNTLNLKEGWTGKTVGTAENFNEINVGSGVEANFTQGLKATEDLVVNAQEGKVTIAGSTADGLDAVVYAAEGATLTINTNNDLVITDTADSAVAIGATGGSAVTIDSTADMTINGAVQAEAVRPGGSTISLKGDDITITAKAAKPSETEGAVRNASIDATGKVTIEADGLCGVGAGPDKATMAQSVNSIKAKEIDITSTNAFGVYANNHSYHAVGTRVHSYLEAETINIKSKKDGIYASNGAVTEVTGFKTLNVTSDEQGIGSEFGVMTFTGGDMTVTSAEEGIRSKLGGDLVFDVDSLKVDAGLESIKLTGDSVMDVEAQKVQLDGDITLEDNSYGSPELNITFNGDESYLNGNVTTSEGGMTNMTFADGAQWTTEGSADSSVSDLTMDGGIINQESTGEITIDNLAGEGNVVFTDGSGQINIMAAESGATLNLSMAGTDADSFNTTDDLNKIANKLDVAETATSNVTGNVHVDEGLLNGAIDMTVEYEDVDGDKLLNGVIKDVQQAQTTTTTESISGVAANAAVAWRDEDATFSQRLGELRNSEGAQGVWTRFTQGEFERGSDFETEYNMFQIGYDKAKDDWHYGVAVSHTEGDTMYAAGSGELSNTSLSAYGTWLGERGHYKDIVAKVGSISSDYSINAAGQLTKGEYDTYGTSLSAEYGMKNDMGSGWYINPLAKMTYMHIGADSYTTNNGISVRHDSVDSLIARLGMEFGKQLGQQGAVYVKASALHDFGGDADTAFRLGSNSALITDEIGGTWYEVGFGFNYKMSDATNLYADVIKTYGDEIRTPWQWNAGVRYSF